MDLAPESRARLEELLRSIYPPAVAATTTAALSARLQAFTPASTAAAAPLDQRSSLLITYGDQVQETGTPPLRVLGEFCRRHLSGVIHGIHLLPFYPFTSDDGFSVTDYFAVNPELGGWPDIADLAKDFPLMFDAVFNHLSARSDWFQKFLSDHPEYRDFFVTVDGKPDLTQVVRPRALPLLTEFPSASGPRRVWTTFSADQVDLNFKNPAVLLRCVDALLFYVAQGARFIRLDAIAYLWKEIGTTCIHLPQTHAVVQLMRAVLDAVAPGVRIITETNVPHADNLSYFGDGTNEAHLVYNFALPPLVLHTLATGNATRLTEWARSLRLPGNQVAFFNFLASHDGIGVNPARGILAPDEIDALVERAQRHGGYVSYKHNADGSRSPYELNVNFFDALSAPDSGGLQQTAIRRFACAHAIQFALAGVPGIYFHSLFGSRNDRAGAETTGIPRRINRQKFSRSELEADLADPASLRSQVFRELRHLLVARGSCAAFHPHAAQEILSVDERVFALRRTSRDGRTQTLALNNVSDAPVSLTVPVDAGAWRHLLPARGVIPAHGDLRLTLAPYEVAWLARESA